MGKRVCNYLFSFSTCNYKQNQVRHRAVVHYRFFHSNFVMLCFECFMYESEGHFIYKRNTSR